MSQFEEVFHSSFYPLCQYLRLAENTENPKQFHLWSLLSLTAAIASNHVWFSQGIVGKFRLNLGVVLIGRSAIRKSSAISFMQRFAHSLPIHYGPTDTGGARHGIMSAMQSRWQDDIRDSIDDEELAASLEELAAKEFDSVVARALKNRTRPSSVYFTSKELGRLLTAQTRELLDFFNDGLDNEPIYYQTKTGSVRIPNPLINLLGATTPGSLPYILPRDSHDHGLLSRIIFVYAAKSEQPVPRPPHISESELNIQADLLDRLNRIVEYADGELIMSPEADAEYKRLYSHKIKTIEFKLNAYSGYRAKHLAKVSAILCLLRGETPYIISREDVGLAHLLLMLTEQEMDGAYAGLDKSQDAKAYAVIREVIESSRTQTGTQGEHLQVLYGHLHRTGFNDEEAMRALDRLKRSGRLVFKHENVELATNLSADLARVYLNKFLDG